MECEACLFGHGCKTDGKVWAAAALGNDLAHTFTRTPTVSAAVVLAHATLASERRVLPCCEVGRGK